MKRLKPLCLLASVFVSCGPSTGDPDSNCEGMLPGDLVITEVLANPSGEDQGGEFIEIFNASSQTIQLTGVILQADQNEDTAPKQFSTEDVMINAGEYLVFGGVLPEFKPDHVDVPYGPALGSLRNSGGRLSLTCSNSIIDAVEYPEAQDGHSTGFDGALTPDATLNDDTDNFCDASEEFLPGSFGSPGTANSPCQNALDGMCIDENGDARELLNPTVGDVVITEVMPNPGAVADNDGEWFEIEALADFDLNALSAGKEFSNLSFDVLSRDCISVTAGDRILFARSDNPVVNGGLPIVDQVFDFGLTNSNSSLVVATQDILLDQVTWISSPQGESIALDPAQTSATANDDPNNFCSGTIPYGDGDLGTPGTINTSCGITTSGMCMDNGSLRPIQEASVADITISEIMANPNAVGDAAGEYIEIRAENTFDLNGLQVGRTTMPTPLSDYTIVDSNCLPVSAGNHILFVRNPDSASNGGLPMTNIFDANISLSQTPGSQYQLYVGYGDSIIDSISYQGSDVQPGVSFSIDESGNQCLSTTSYGDGDLGTPGASNPLCP